MANPTTTVTEYCSLLTRSRLLPAAEVSVQFEKWRAAANPPATDAHVEAFRRYLVANRCLTEYQAVMLQRGHADGFYVGGYVILGRIGKGATAGVYKAVHSSGQLVALKVLPGSKARSAHMLGRFQREGRLLTQLNHPNVVRAYQVGESNGVHYIAMEYLEGETLDEAIARRQKFPPAEAVRLATQALRGLQHLHERRMVHRDLKPANLMVIPGKADATLSTLDATLKILDIGLGRELFEDGPETRDQNLTVEGSLVGTPDYLAPEQARDARATDIRADIYSLGCVLYHLLAGRPPFQERNVMATMVKHATEAIPTVTQFNAAVPPGLVVALDRLLAKDPAGRFQTPGEAAEALRPFLPANSVSASESTMIPAFQKWIESESEFERPAEKPPTPSMGGPRSQGGSGPTSLGGPRSMGGSGPKSLSGSGPKSMTIRRSGAVQVGGLGAAASPSLPTTSSAAPPSLKPPSVPSRPGLPPPSAPLIEIDVELVTMPFGPQADINPLDRVVSTPPPRPLYELDRRDFIMLGCGAGAVFGAIVGGYFAAQAMRDKVNRGGEEVQQANQP